MNGDIYYDDEIEQKAGRVVGFFPHYLGSNFNLNIVRREWEKLHPKSELWNTGITTRKFIDILKESKEYYAFEKEYLENYSKKTVRVKSSPESRKKYKINWQNKRRQNDRVLSNRFSL
jgi:hypothetical protein